MFGTLHWKSHTKEAEFVERPHGSSVPEKNSACDRCRAKKVMLCEDGKHLVKPEMCTDIVGHTYRSNAVRMMTVAVDASA